MAQLSTRIAGYRAPSLAPRSELVAIGSVALVAAALGWVVVRFDGFGGDLGSAALLTTGGIACVVVIMAGPVACVAAVAALTASGLSPVIGHVGGVDLTLADLFYGGLVGWWLVRMTERGERSLPSARPPIAFGQLIAIAFLAYAGLTLLKVAISESAVLSDSLISWLRLVQTASLAWLAASVIDTGRDLRLLLSAITIGGLVAIATAVVGGSHLLTARFAGTLDSPDTLGLVSGFVLLTAAFGGMTPKASYRIALAAGGLLGLLLAKSVASFVATGLVLAVGASLASVGPAPAARRVTRLTVIAAVVAVAVFGVVKYLRPDVTPGSPEFTSSSTYQRLVLGATGVEIFERNPVIGVGWRASNSPVVTTNRAIATEVRRLFPNADPAFYPDSLPESNTEGSRIISSTSVHNTYIQILADLGLVGFLLLAALIVVVTARVRDLLRRLGRNHELWSPAWVMSLGLLLVLVWVNDNPLYGGQPETVIPALCVGALAATSRMARRPSDQSAVNIGG